jgi:hypothetical protein
MSPRLRAEYETVNGAPQLASTDDQFAFYWSVWRTLTSEEKSRMGSSGSLMSERSIAWNISRCQNGQAREKRETFWYWDPIRLDSRGEIIPIPEANRPNYLYLNLINLNSSRLWGAASSSPRGTKGSLTVDAIHRIYSNSLSFNPNEFYSLQNYLSESHPNHDEYQRYSPYYWPIFYDERAHKLHSLYKPNFWDGKEKPMTENVIRLKLSWDGCHSDKPITVKLQVPKGQNFPRGPQRPGRTESGDSSIEIEETL